ncbi:MAG: LysM peptidoglycan-binding domain-containing protein [Acidaminococcaceae bacterium]|nr:LysM peptidoglycan-binding domain-containing protein [Acidaminococcaceae bacterium]MBQ5343854.1 LysM peptidoglycan-binding domain-containing protein [Acidaminococcaceae bacterium]
MKKMLAVMAAMVACACYMSMDPEMDVTDISYTVQTGDTVWAIAERYADTQVKPFCEFVFEIQEKNNLAGKHIIPGDQLVIPLWTRAKK